MAVPKRDLENRLMKLEWTVATFITEMEFGEIEDFSEVLKFARKHHEELKLLYRDVLVPGVRRTKEKQIVIEYGPTLEDTKIGIKPNAEETENGTKEVPEDVHENSGQNSQVQRKRKTTPRRN